MKQIPKAKLDEILKEMADYPFNEVMVPREFIVDIITEVKKLRYKVSKPRREAKKNEG